MQTILTKNPDIDVAVYTIWFRGYRGGSREAWPKELLTDKRVTHYWDDQDIVGTWFAKQGKNKYNVGGSMKTPSTKHLKSGPPGG